MDWLSSHSTVRDTTWQITVTDKSLLVTPINPCSAQSILILPLILMLPCIATLQLQTKFRKNIIRTKITSKSPGWMTRPLQRPITLCLRLDIYYNENIYACEVWIQCQWSCIIYIYIMINNFIIQTGRTAQCNFLTYMYYGWLSDSDDDVYQLREIYANMGIKSGHDRVCDTIHVNNNNKRIFQYLHFRLTIIWYL
jgi:hypothetical protein